MSSYTIALHGGAGTILKSQMTPEKELAYTNALKQALKEGEDILRQGGPALDAVEKAVISLENEPLFNAGRGAVFTNEGKNELDASIMNGRDLSSGAVAGVCNIQNPVSLARAVMEQSEHVLLVSRGAENFAKRINAPTMPDDYFFVQQRYDQLQQALQSNSVQLDHTAGDEKKFGTVGAVARDLHGNLAAATSTGGMTNKKFGRVGDTPIIGSGTYANNHTCAVSCTGHGEFFIRAVVAYDISCLMEYKGLSLKEACQVVVMDKLVKLGGEGGLVAVDKNGHYELVFNSEGMYRAAVSSGAAPYVGIYK